MSEDPTSSWLQEAIISLQNEQAQPPTIFNNSVNTKNSRRNYRCGVCGMPKKNHICGNIEEQTNFRRVQEQQQQHQTPQQTQLNHALQTQQPQQPQQLQIRRRPFRFIGFCGIDDTVDPELLRCISAQYPFVEWGVLFRPDKAGTPRYASDSYVDGRLLLAYLKSNHSMNLAAHFCGERVNEVLRGDDKFVKKLQGQGFNRIQINATAINGVNTEHMESKVALVRSVIVANPSVEFIIQYSVETQILLNGLLHGTTSEQAQAATQTGQQTNNYVMPSNVSVLFDESKGTGKLLTSFTAPPPNVNIGYAGGIGPDSIVDVVKEILKVTSSSSRNVWIDMESSLRTKGSLPESLGRIPPAKDIFDVNKVFETIRKICEETECGFTL